MYQAQALTEAREEFGKYFDALEQHPRLLAGQRVPKLDGSDGDELLKDAADAKEWQDALKHVLVEEIQSRVAKIQADQSGFLDTVHASIDLFKNNSDLVPYTKDFDVELASRFAEMATPYELRVEGKLQGYSIPVQPLIDQLRARISTERAAAPPAQAPAADKGAAGAPPAPAAPAPDPPQAGIPNKAGNSGEQGEDMSAFWGTLNLPNLTL